jgi:hypothetical protein
MDWINAHQSEYLSLVDLQARSLSEYIERFLKRYAPSWTFKKCPTPWPVPCL